jgi:hypothetical protein
MTAVCSTPTHTHTHTHTYIYVCVCSSSGLYDKHITIVNDDSRVTLQTVASLTSIIDDTN